MLNNSDNLWMRNSVHILDKKKKKSRLWVFIVISFILGYLLGSI